MGRIVDILVGLHDAVFGLLARAARGWFLGLAARAVFASVLLVYFWNSAMTKAGPGLLGFLMPTDGAYAQILPTMMEQVGYDVSQIAFFPYGLIVVAGTLAEFVLPLLVALGLFTRVSSLGMLVFIAVMSFVDITGHHVEPATIGAVFDGIHDSAILDQRLLWAFPLVYLVLNGAGALSIDWLLARRRRRSVFM